MMLKRLGSANDWYVYHYGISANPSSEFLILNTNAAIGNSGGAWSDTEPDSVNFTVGSRTNVNATDGMIAYCFAEISGYSKFGSFTGNASLDGPFCYTGFKPSFVLIKNTASLSDWNIYDNRRSTSGGDNVVDYTLLPNTAAVEDTATTYNDIDMYSNGFKIREDNGDCNGSGQKLIYMAFGQPIISNSGVVATAR